MTDENLARGGSSIDSARLRLVFRCSAGLMVLAAFALAAVPLKMGRASSFADLLATIAHNPLPVIGPVVLALLGLILAVQATNLVWRFAALPVALAAHRRAVALGVTVAGFAGSLAVVWALRAFPNSADEYAFLFEADTFLAARLWNPLPPLHEAFAFLHISQADGKWAALYPPGWPLLLAGVRLFALPFWLACPLAGIVLLFAVFKLGQRQDGPLGGILALSLVALSPFFLFNAGSYFTHVPAAAAGALFCWMGADFLDRPRFSRGFLAGVALGILGLIRVFDPLLFGLPFLFAFVWRAGRRHYVLAPSIVFGGLPFLAALLLFYGITSGSILPKIASPEAPLLRFGLYSVDEDGLPHTPLDQLRLAARFMGELAVFTSPLLLLGYPAAFAWKATKKQLNFFDFIFPVTVAALLLIPFDGGNRYGPRYYFEAYPFFVLTTVSALVPLLQNRAQPRRAASVVSLVFAHAAWCIAAVIFLGWLFRGIVEERMDLYNKVRAKGLHDAAVVIHSGTGRFRGFTPEDLTRNGLAIDGDVIYALDIPHRLGELRELFPHRRFYIYTRSPDNPTGTLDPL
jgi:Dolichyl-phosphate-mannose-protein mannosyltransferase